MPAATKLDSIQPPRKFRDIRAAAAPFDLSIALFRKLSRLADFPVLRCGRACRYDHIAVQTWFEQRGKRG
jgi:hypothetical protein